MATQPIGDRFVPVEEYLSTVYEPDCEYDGGVVAERNTGEFDHSFLQAILGSLFTIHASDWGVFGLIAQRIQVDPMRFLVPDLCVLKFGGTWESILTTPPLIAIEIYSPDDSIRRITKKAGVYLEFGVQHVWVVDPLARVGYRGESNSLELVPDGVFTVPGTPIQVSISELFEKLDRIHARGSRCL